MPRGREALRLRSARARRARARRGPAGPPGLDAHAPCGANATCGDVCDALAGACSPADLAAVGFAAPGCGGGGACVSGAPGDDVANATEPYAGATCAGATPAPAPRAARRPPATPRAAQA